MSVTIPPRPGYKLTGSRLPLISRGILNPGELAYYPAGELHYNRLGLQLFMSFFFGGAENASLILTVAFDCQSMEQSAGLAANVHGKIS